MIAVDTNLVVRYLTGDHPDQAARARVIIDGQNIFVAVTVLMEVEWVLRKTFGFDRTAIGNAIHTFSGMPTVTMEDDRLVAEALDLFTGGMDFADALHLLKSRHCETFATFDQAFVKAAHATGHLFVVEA